MHPYFIKPLFTDNHFDGLQFFNIVNTNITMNIFEIFSSLCACQVISVGQILRSGIAGSKLPFFWLCLQHAEVPRPGIKMSHSCDNTESLTARPPGNSFFFFNALDTFCQVVLPVELDILKNWIIPKSEML